MPPPPVHFFLEPRTRHRLEAAIFLAAYKRAEVVTIDWTVAYWSGPRPHGTIAVSLG